jgi:uncharacterized LabA/DUF88 family protein
MYISLQKAGYILVFKEVLRPKEGHKAKGNVDAELVLQAMIEVQKYDRAIIMTSDGDFACLVRYLKEQGKLERVLSPNKKGCSILLRKAAGEKMGYLDDVRDKIEYKK